MEKEELKRFIKILNWCKENPLDKGYVYEINAYVCEHLFGTSMGITVSPGEIACCYKLLGYDVKKSCFLTG